MNAPLSLLLSAEAAASPYLQPGGVAFNLAAFLAATLLGGLLACILTVVHQAVIGRFLRALLRAGATSRESAKTLEELGLRGMLLGFGMALRKPSSLLRKLVFVVLPDGSVIAPIESLDDKAIREAEGADAANTAEDASAPSAATSAAADIPDVKTAAFYLDDLHRRRAEVRFLKRGNEVFFLVPAVLAFAALAVTLPKYLPLLANLLDTVIRTVVGG